MIKIIHGDCLEKMQQIEDNSIDSIVTDPPYGISFMNKKWDYDIPKKEVFEEMLRVLKPGGHILCACGTRTQHRMACNIEDAGFEIRDVVSWIYGSGFPKSLNIRKAVDKLQGNDREIVCEKDVKPGWHKDHLQNDDSWTGSEDKGINITKGTSPYEGQGTALKPAQEFFTLARKPLSEKTIAKNVLKWGTGGINIDGCRVEGIDPANAKRIGKNYTTENTNFSDKVGQVKSAQVGGSLQGRFPANIIHDGSEEVLELFPETKSGGGNKGNKQNNTGMFGNGKTFDTDNVEPSKGSAARFFYCAKASKSERTCKGQVECNHPTIKPIKLMQYLCRLITPKEGTALDPFMGSGSTGIAAKLEGFDFIGIEMEKEYCDIAEARIKAF